MAKLGCSSVGPMACVAARPFRIRVVRNLIVVRLRHRPIIDSSACEGNGQMLDQNEVASKKGYVGLVGYVGKEGWNRVAEEWNHSSSSSSMYYSSLTRAQRRSWGYIGLFTWRPGGGAKIGFRV